MARSILQTVWARGPAEEPRDEETRFFSFFVFLLLNKGLLANLPLFALEEDIIFIIVARKQVCPLPRGSYSLRPPRLFAV